MNHSPALRSYRHALWLLLLALSFALVTGCSGDDDDNSATGDDDDATGDDDTTGDDDSATSDDDDTAGDDDSAAGDDDDTTGDDDSAAGDDDTTGDDDSAGDDDDDSAPVWQLAIAGTWADSWGADHTITDTTWVQTWGTYNISQFDNSAQVVIAENDFGNSSGAGLWSRFDWHWDANSLLWYCQTCYDCADEAGALATAAADSSDPAIVGCGGFSWTSMTPAP